MPAISAISAIPNSDVSKLVAERGGYDLMPEMGYAPVNKYLPPRPRQTAAGCTGAPSALEAAERIVGRQRRPAVDRSTAVALEPSSSMHPASSVIFFTVASGAGYGLLLLLGIGGALGWLPPDRWFGVAAFGLSLAAITFGLLSSTFHLGHPERAWRAVSQWRSSWLSREGLASLIAYFPAVVFAAGWIVRRRHSGAWGLFG